MSVAPLRDCSLAPIVSVSPHEASPIGICDITPRCGPGENIRAVVAARASSPWRERRGPSRPVCPGCRRRSGDVQAEQARMKGATPLVTVVSTSAGVTEVSPCRPAGLVARRQAPSLPSLPICGKAVRSSGGAPESSSTARSAASWKGSNTMSAPAVRRTLVSPALCDVTTT